MTTQITVMPSLLIGQRVQYTEDGILSMYYGVISKWSFDAVNERIVYLVTWDLGTDNKWYPKSYLHPVS